MRLTLRTLLAYHHGVLGAADHEDLHRRIQQNEDAGRLLRRIDTLTKQSQVIAPRLDKGAPGELGSDPNSIAEYLDDALHGTKVPELERICLESDEHLAELAHCHELLVAAMRTQVTVPNALRRTAVEIVDPQHREALASKLLTRTTKRTKRGQPLPGGQSPNGNGAMHDVQVAAPMVASGGESIRPEGLSLEGAQLAHEVPEYLVGSARGRWKVPVGISALAALLAVLVWQSLGPWDRVRELFQATPPPAPIFDDDPPLVVRVEDEEPQEPDNTVFHELVISQEPPPPIANTGDSVPAASVEESSEAPPVPGMPSGETSTSDAASSDMEATSEAPPIPPSAGGDSAIETSDGAPPIPAGVESDTSIPPIASPDAAGSEAAQAEGTAIWSTPAGAESVLLTGQGDAIRLVMPNDAVGFGSDLIALPTTRGSIHFPSGLVWSTRGASLMQLGDQGISTVFCRGLLRSSHGTPFNLATPTGKYDITPTDASSLAAIEYAYRRVKPGLVTDRSAYVPTLVIIAAEGTTQVSHPHEDGDIRTHELLLGEGLAAVEGQRPVKFKLTRVPNWLRPDYLRPIDSMATVDLYELLKSDGPSDSVSKVLPTLVSHRRPETAALAIQAALLVNDWQPLINDLLNEDRFRSHWTPTLDLARQILAASPGSDKSLREQFIAKYGVKQGEELLQSLLGPSADQIAADGVSGLIDQLDSDALPNRVMAAYQLQLLTGQTMSYQAHAPNRASIQQWRRESAMRKLSIPEESDPVIERTK
ncbi:MAG: hypothetical protein R3C53_27460 [Pirellulaceae bacterium]